jgi:hypothetical protein
MSLQEAHPQQVKRHENNGADEHPVERIGNMRKSTDLYRFDKEVHAPLAHVQPFHDGGHFRRECRALASALAGFRDRRRAFFAARMRLGFDPPRWIAGREGIDRGDLDMVVAIDDWSWFADGYLSHRRYPQRDGT